MVMRSESDRNPRPRASCAEVATFAVAIVSKAFFIASIISTEPASASPETFPREAAALSTARSSISLQPPPPGSRPTPTSTSPCIKLSVRLARSGVQRDFRAAAQAQAERRGDHRLRRKLDRLRHALKLADGEVDIVPLFFLHAHQQQHQVGADGKIRGIVGDDESVEVVAGAAGLQRLNDQADDVGSRASSSWSETRCRPRRRPDRSATRRNFSSPRRWISSRPSPTTRPRELQPVASCRLPVPNTYVLTLISDRRRTTTSGPPPATFPRSPRPACLLFSCERRWLPRRRRPKVRRDRVPS